MLDAPILTSGTEKGPLKTEFCQACPVPHPFVRSTAGGLIYTHSVDQNGDVKCRDCSDARPCQGTIVRGRSGRAYAQSAVQEKTRHRGLSYDGPFR